MAVQGVSANRGLLHFTAQGSLGTYVGPTVGTTLATQCESVTLELLGEPDINREDEVDAVPGGLDPLLGRRGWKLSFVAKLVQWGDTTSETGHSLASFFGACPMKITEHGGPDGSPLTLDPIASFDIDVTDHDKVAPCSILFSEDEGNDYKIVDATCRVVRIFSEAAGAPVKIEGECFGLWEATPGAATVGDFTTAKFSEEPVMLNKGITLTEQIATGAPVGLSAWEFDPGHILEEMPDATATHGLSAAYCGHGGYARLKMNVNAVDEGVLGVFTEWLAVDPATAGGGGSWSLQTATIGGSGTSDLTVALTNGYLAVPGRGEGGGVRKWDLEVRGRSTVSSGVPAVDHYQVTFS